MFSRFAVCCSPKAVEQVVSPVNDVSTRTSVCCRPKVAVPALKDVCIRPSVCCRPKVVENVVLPATPTNAVTIRDPAPVTAPVSTDDPASVPESVAAVLESIPEDNKK